MTLGEKVRQERTARGMSQEQLAEKLIVSRAAVAKWETDNGMPDIENLKKLSALFNISMDELVDNSVIKNSRKMDTILGNYYEKYIGKKCSVEMIDWNDGIWESYILNQDDNFLFYVTIEKKRKKVGALAKKYIEKVILCSEKETCGVDFSDVPEIQKNYFINKTVNIYLEDKHLWDGMLGKDVEIPETGMKDFDENFVKLVSGREIETERVVKIEMQLDC